MRDLTQFQCPECGLENSSSSGRTCKSCGYTGDWIQPGEVMTYAKNKQMLGVETIAELLPALFLTEIEKESEIAERIFDISRQPRYR